MIEIKKGIYYNSTYVSIIKHVPFLGDLTNSANYKASQHIEATN